MLVYFGIMYQALNTISALHHTGKY